MELPFHIQVHTEKTGITAVCMAGTRNTCHTASYRVTCKGWAESERGSAESLRVHTRQTVHSDEIG